MTQETQDTQVTQGDTSTQAPYGEPVGGGGAHPTTPTQAAPKGSDVIAQLGEYLQGLKHEREAPKPTVEEEAPQRPTGGLNELSAEDVHIPGLSRFIQLLDLHYPTLDRDRAVGKAIEYGDASYIDEAYIREAAGDGAEVLIGFFEDAVQVYGEGIEQTLTQVYEMAGGKERWDGIAGAFTRNAPEGIRRVVKGLVDSTNPDEVRQGLEFILEYASTTGLTDTPAKRVGTSGTPGGGDGLSAAQFREELRKLGGRNRDPRAYDSAVEQLRKRRALGVELGL